MSENGGRKKQHAGRECRGHSRSQDPRGRWVFFTFRDKTKLVHLSSLKEGVRVSSLKEGVRGAAWSRNSSPVQPMPNDVASKNTQRFAISRIVTSTELPSSIAIASTRLPVGKSFPVNPLPSSRKSTRISDPVPGTPPMVALPATRASPLSTSRVTSFRCLWRTPGRSPFRQARSGSCSSSERTPER